MTDVVDQSTRSRMMSGIKSKNTKPELLIRSILHKRGFRYRIHITNLPGKPDIVLKKYNSVIFIHGCFWHGHDCYLFKWPKTRKKFWKEKINYNRNNDNKVIDKLKKQNWRICIIWECTFKGSNIKNLKTIVDKIDKWLNSNNKFLEISS